MTAALLQAAIAAERFIAGFEGDPLQDGVDGLLADLRAAIRDAERPLVDPRQLVAEWLEVCCTRAGRSLTTDLHAHFCGWAALHHGVDRPPSTRAFCDMLIDHGVIAVARDKRGRKLRGPISLLAAPLTDGPQPPAPRPGSPRRADARRSAAPPAAPQGALSISWGEPE